MFRDTLLGLVIFVQAVSSMLQTPKTMDQLKRYMLYMNKATLLFMAVNPLTSYLFSLSGALEYV